MQACYRHPDRETGVACSNCGRPICPDCMTTTSVGMRCPECARERTRVRQLPATARDTPTLTYILSGGSGGVSGIGTDTIVRDGALSRATVADGEVYRVITSGFIHAGVTHLL